MVDKKIPGVGWTLPRGARTSRGGIINVDAHPLGRAYYGEAANPIKYPPHTLLRRWPEWNQGYGGQHPPAHQTEILETLWRARRIPDLSLADHDRYTGIATAEEINDLYALAETHRHYKEITRVWMELSAPPAVDPKPDPKPEPGPVTPPVVPPIQVGGLRPLSPAAVRVEELRAHVIQTPTHPDFVLPILALDKQWPTFKPFAIEALRFYRLVRARLGDTRSIPPEDR